MRHKLSIFLNKTKLFTVLSICIVGFSGLIFFNGIQSPVQATSSEVVISLEETVSTFDSSHLGLGLVNWEFTKYWNESEVNNPAVKPGKFINEVPGLKVALEEIKPGILRYAGGLWANSVGFDGTPQKFPYHPYTVTDQYPQDTSTYWFHYGTDEIDSLGTFAKDIGSEVMIQVNISDYNPDMWADMVRYTNVTHDYRFKYWEIGNELNYDEENGMSAQEYVSRFTEYKQKMLAVDPTIKVLGAGVSTAIHEPHTDPSVPYNNSELSLFLKDLPSGTQANGTPVDAITYHWYQQCDTSNYEDISRYQFYDGTSGQPIDQNIWNNRYSRKWADLIPKRIDKEILKNHPNTTLGITELNINACNNRNKSNNNHFAALWFADVLGRLAYNGVDFTTSYHAMGIEDYGLLKSTEDAYGNRTGLSVNSSYYIFLMYAKYFYDQMVVSQVSNAEKISAWAARKSDDPSKISLMLTNFSTTPHTLSTTLNTDKTPKSTAKYYTLSPKEPPPLASNSNPNIDLNSSLNGISFDGLSLINTGDRSEFQNLVQSIQPETKNISFQDKAFEITIPELSTIVIQLELEESRITDFPNRAGDQFQKCLRNQNNDRKGRFQRTPWSRIICGE